MFIRMKEFSAELHFDAFCGAGVAPGAGIGLSLFVNQVFLGFREVNACLYLRGKQWPSEWWRERSSMEGMDGRYCLTPLASDFAECLPYRGQHGGPSCMSDWETVIVGGENMIPSRELLLVGYPRTKPCRISDSVVFHGDASAVLNSRMNCLD
jgi:hypothetical protein